MALQREFETEGDWLFRWRSYVPLGLTAVLFSAMRGFDYPWQSHEIDTAVDIFCLVVSLFGFAVRVSTVGFVPNRTSGRNTAGQVADSLNTTGMYSVLRHPLYFGNFWIWFGISLFPRVWWCPVIVALAFLLFYERVMFAEERFLRDKFGARFHSWAAVTPAIWPKFSLWQPSARGFSLKAVLRRENSTLFAIIVGFFVLEEVGTVIAEGRIAPDSLWAVLFVSGLAAYLALKILKRARLLTTE
jgi:protein-S-isoprenylcysteine O-methyltransferase Ste14